MIKTTFQSKQTCKLLGTVASMLLISPLAMADTTFKFGGFVKLDVISSDFGDGELAADNLGRDYYVPGGIPVGGTGGSRGLEMHAKSSRVNLLTTTNVEGHKVGAFVEFDFVTASANERVTNGYQPQLRHAYFTFDKWLFGQTWSTFQNVGALPEMLDYIGPTEGTVFVRQAQVRYTRDNWQFSLENPETYVVDSGNFSDADDGGLPDLVGRYNWNGEKASISFAGIVRELRTETGNNKETEFGLGFSVGGKLAIGDGGNDLRFMVTSGKGLGRYVGIGAIADTTVADNGSLEAIDVTSAFLAYRQVWNSKWRSNFSYSMITADQDSAYTGTNITKNTDSIHANILYSPITKITLGAELTYAKRELENGNEGKLNRLQFSARYDF